ncbi:MAG: HlyD family efflux transporter periplasmic adaptor subunit [Dehalococcoidia bacterium]|nr:HlyD family efflux transporter periplasmic adaptor subunit [Dehalococcoidia bacterium]
MLINRMFRERALRRRGRQEPLDDRLQITAPHEWLIVAGLCVMVLAVMAFSVFGRVERTVSVEAALVLPGERHYLVAPASGTVEDVFVAVTDTIAPGQPVARIRPSDAQHWESVIVGVINGLEKGDQLEEEARIELLQALLVAGSAASSTAQMEVASPYGGEVIALNLAPGQAVDGGASVGLVRAASTSGPEVVALVAPSDAATLSAGMEARVSFGGPDDGGRQVFQGRVAEVSARPSTPPKWLADQGLAILQQAHLLRVALAGNEPDVLPADGAVASLRIVLGRESLVSLLASGSGG